jgi:hypothetical protein
MVTDKRSDSQPIEHAEDRRRGQLPHIQRSIAMVRVVATGAARCDAHGCSNRASVVLGARALCGDCAARHVRRLAARSPGRG